MAAVEQRMALQTFTMETVELADGHTANVYTPESQADVEAPSAVCFMIPGFGMAAGHPLMEALCEQTAGLGYKTAVLEQRGRYTGDRDDNNLYSLRDTLAAGRHLEDALVPFGHQPAQVVRAGYSGGGFLSVHMAKQGYDTRLLETTDLIALHTPIGFKGFKTSRSFGNRALRGSVPVGKEGKELIRVHVDPSIIGDYVEMSNMGVALCDLQAEHTPQTTWVMSPGDTVADYGLVRELAERPPAQGGIRSPRFELETIEGVHHNPTDPKQIARMVGVVSSKLALRHGQQA